MAQQIKRAGYAVLGGYQLAYEKAYELLGKARTTGRKDVEGLYADLAKRGERLVKKVSQSKPAKRAAQSTRQAQKQLKGAATSVRKAVGLEEEQEKAKAAS